MLSRILYEGGFFVYIKFQLAARVNGSRRVVILDYVKRYWPGGADVSAYSSVPDEIPVANINPSGKIGFVMTEVSSMMLNWTTDPNYALCEIASPDL